MATLIHINYDVKKYITVLLWLILAVMLFG